jgi:hypothetical protein
LYGRRPALLVFVASALLVGGGCTAEREDAPAVASSELNSFDWDSLKDPFDAASCAGRALQSADRKSLFNDGQPTTAPGEYRAFLRNRVCTVRGTPKPWEANVECPDWNPVTNTIPTIKAETRMFLFFTLSSTITERGSASKGRFFLEEKGEEIDAVFEGLGALHVRLFDMASWGEDPGGMRPYYWGDPVVGSKLPLFAHATEQLTQTIGNGCMRIELQMDKYAAEDWGARYTKDKDFQYTSYDFVAYGKFETAK